VRCSALILILALDSAAVGLQAQRAPSSTPDPYRAEERLSPRGRSDWLLARGAKKAMERRYRSLHELREGVTEFEVRGPSQVVPFDAIGVATLQFRVDAPRRSASSFRPVSGSTSSSCSPLPTPGL
jgi:hypothetical protein